MSAEPVMPGTFETLSSAIVMRQLIVAKNEIGRGQQMHRLSGQSHPIGAAKVMCEYYGGSLDRFVQLLCSMHG